MLLRRIMCSLYMAILDYKENHKKPNNYECKICYFRTMTKRDFERHIHTQKHQMATNGLQDTTEKNHNFQKYTCIYCTKEYKHHSSLWKHKRSCKHQYDEDVSDLVSMGDKNLILTLINENKEFKKIIIDQNKTIQDLATKVGNQNSNNNTNSHNKTAFNLQFYLNETCKNAMNISEFVESIKPSLKDLEYVGRKGYVEGVSNIILQKLKNMDYTYRPIHCSDSKRDILFVKDNNEWHKDDEQKLILTRAIKQIAHENIKNINEWRIQNPGCTDPDSKKNDIWLHIVSNSMSGSTKDESDSNIGKIISNIAKEVVIVK